MENVGAMLEKYFAFSFLIRVRTNETLLAFEVHENYNLAFTKLLSQRYLLFNVYYNRKNHNYTLS